MTASGLSTSKLPPNANCTSFHCDPGVVQRRADRVGTHVDRRLRTPTAERVQPDSDDRDVGHVSCPPGRREREGHDLGAVRVGAERHDHELDLHADPQLRHVGLGEPTLHPDLVAELHEPHAVGPEGLLRLAARVGLLREELLGRERPERAPARQQVRLDLDRSAPGARRLLWERHRARTTVHRPPISCGSSDGHVNTSGAKATCGMPRAYDEPERTSSDEQGFAGVAAQGAVRLRPAAR